MPKAMAILAVFLSAVILAAPATAEVGVSPSPESSAVHIGALKYKRHQLPSINSKADPSKPNDADYLVYGGFGCVEQPDGTDQCFGNGLVPPPTTPAKLTPGDILTAVKKIGLPSLRINIQPGGETLVNFDTILYAQPQPFRRDVTLLGYDIDLVATPARYTWQHGDGTSHTTSRPGKPYPSKDVIHRYQQPAKNLHPSVDVTYEVRFRVDGGAWQNLSQTLQASGPTGDLDVKEATPVLVGG